jgi:hypothetical protein
MNIIGQEFTSYVRSLNCTDDAKRIIDAIYLRTRNHFTDVSTGDNIIVFSNGFFMNLFSNYEEFGQISNGEINIELKHNHIVLRSNVYFRKFILMYLALLLVVILQILSFSPDSVVFAIIFAVIFIAYTFIHPQYTARRFRLMVSNCIDECGLTMK